MTKKISPLTVSYFILKSLSSSGALDIKTIIASVTADMDSGVSEGTVHGTLSRLRVSHLVKSIVEVDKSGVSEVAIQKYVITEIGEKLLKEAVDKVFEEAKSAAAAFG